MKSPASKLSRRNFLFAVGAGGVAATAAVTSANRSTAQKKTSGTTSGKGYQLTEHVRKYYETTKV
ncbi:MAG: twin-arginine translocation signal domain-containing protein [Betaproteobacteria bacterium]